MPTSHSDRYSRCQDCRLAWNSIPGVNVCSEQESCDRSPRHSVPCLISGQVWVPLEKAAAEDITQDDATRTVVAHLPDRGATVGTIAYMSAEQALGQTNLTAQSGQFSLGLVLYELAAGRRAFPRQRG